MVLSETFRENLRSKGVPAAKIARIYNPASRPLRELPRAASSGEPGAVLTMGNIGYSQNLEAIVRAFESNAALERLGATLVLAGDGVAGDEVRAAIRTERVSVTGIVDNRRLTDELRRARVALVSQHYEGAEFNVPSKLMNFMGDGLATVASVGPQSEVARILRDSGGGWVTSSLRPEEAMETLASVLPDDILLAERGKSALEFARTNFAAEHTAALFEEVLLHAVAGRPRGSHFG